MAVKGYCIDSDILIDFLRGIEKARDFLVGNAQKHALYISVVSVVELYAGKNMKRSAAIEEVERLIKNFEVVPLDRERARRAGTLRREYGIPFADAIIAATALDNAVGIVTRNVKHFRAIGKAKGLPLMQPY